MRSPPPSRNSWNFSTRVIDFPPRNPLWCARHGTRGSRCEHLPRTGRGLREGVIDVIQIRLKKGEDVGRALKRMKKILDKEGLMKQLRANRYFEKPSEKQRRKSARARARARARRSANP